MRPDLSHRDFVSEYEEGAAELEELQSFETRKPLKRALNILQGCGVILCTFC